MLLKYFTFTVMAGVFSVLILNVEEPNYYLELTLFKFKESYAIFKSYFTPQNKTVIKEKMPSGDTLFTVDELKKYDGKNGKEELYLAILGRVYDVSSGRKFYAPGGAYHGFTGCDGSKAFLTGDFSEEGLTDDISDLSDEDLNSINDWVKMYDTTYKFKGVLIGRFYDNNGNPTLFLKEIKKRIVEYKKTLKAKSKIKERYPPCNMEWSEEKGSHVWCSKRSGGIERDWVGVPRKYYEPGATTYRCACVNEQDDKLGTFKEYKNCHHEAQSCYVTEEL